MNPETGLPELPEVYRWRVREQMWYPPSSVWTGLSAPTGKLEVVIEKHTPRVDRKKRDWWNLPSTELVDAWSTVGKPVVIQGRHPIAVRNAANRALRLWNEEGAHKSLIGVYPPKRLEI